MRLHLVTLGVFIYCGCSVASYRDATQREFAAIRAIHARDQLPIAAMELAQRECLAGAGESPVAWQRCKTLHGALDTLAGIRRALREEPPANEPIATCRFMGALAVKRARTNQRAWSEANAFSEQNPRSQDEYDSADALGLVAEAAAACEIDRELMIRASALLQASTAESYQALAVEVNIAAELAVSPQAPLDSYTRTISAMEERIERAFLSAQAESADDRARASLETVPAP